MTRPARILLIDDELPIQRAVAPCCARGIHVDLGGTGRSRARCRGAQPPDLIVLDLGLPDIEGIELCRRMREESKAPIIVLSARTGEAGKVKVLDLGADDYITKPFSPEELLARIRVALRRVVLKDLPEAGRVRVGDLTIDYDRRRVFRQDDEIRLTPKEFELLSLFAHNPDRVLTHRTILKAIWGANAVTQPEHLWVLMASCGKRSSPIPRTRAIWSASPGSATDSRPKPLVSNAAEARSN